MQITAKSRAQSDHESFAKFIRFRSIDKAMVKNKIRWNVFFRSLYFVCVFFLQFTVLMMMRVYTHTWRSRSTHNIRYANNSQTSQSDVGDFVGVNLNKIATLLRKCFIAFDSCNNNNKYELDSKCFDYTKWQLKRGDCRLAELDNRHSRDAYRWLAVDRCLMVQMFERLWNGHLTWI